VIAVLVRTDADVSKGARLAYQGQRPLTCADPNAPKAAAPEPD
jgi:hypothetical protein